MAISLASALAQAAGPSRTVRDSLSASVYPGCCHYCLLRCCTSNQGAGLLLQIVTASGWEFVVMGSAQALV